MINKTTLDGRSKAVLKYILKNDLINKDFEANKINIPYNFKPLTTDQIENSLLYLADIKFIEYTIDLVPSYCIDKVSYEARNYNKFQRLRFKDFLFKSILSPILVSVTTSGICYYLFNK